MKRILQAFLYSWAGLRCAFKEEAAFRQECVLFLILLPATLYLPLTLVFKALIFCSIIFVMLVELINSAIEAVVDKASPERHPLAKKAKDMGSAAVLLALINLVVVCVLAVFNLVQT